MNRKRHSRLPVGLMVLAFAWICDICADSRRRKHRHEAKQQVHDWENEGGAVPPPRPASPSGAGAMS